jgi:hypothetical protein
MSSIIIIFKTPKQGSDCKAVSDENECSDGASVSELIIYPEEKMSEASVTLRTPRVKMEKEIEPRQDLTSVEMEENSISEVTCLSVSNTIIFYLKIFMFYNNNTVFYLQFIKNIFFFTAIY